MLKEGKVYVPKDKALRVEIIRLHHDTPMGGHGGQWKTAEMVARSNEGSKAVCGGVQRLPEK